jgi:peptidoglycan/LPS O-acetylase OafA/YrhL
MTELLRKPGAWLPIALSLVALAWIVGYVALFGVVEHEDEGAPARLFQLTMAVQAVLIGAFAILWLPRAPREAAAVIALQVVVAALPIATVVVLESGLS